MLNNPKWNEPSRTDFIDWLRSHDSNETYEYHDSCGGCLMGRYMASKGMSWNCDRYAEMCTQVLGIGCLNVLTGSPRTFGGALARALQMSPADRVWNWRTLVE